MPGHAKTIDLHGRGAVLFFLVYRCKNFASTHIVNILENGFDSKAQVPTKEVSRLRAEG